MGLGCREVTPDYPLILYSAIEFTMKDMQSMKFNALSKGRAVDLIPIIAMNQTRRTAAERRPYH